MPGNHGEISVDEQQNGGDNDAKRTKRRKKKKKKKNDDDDAKGIEIAVDLEKGNQLLMPLISNSRKRLIAKIGKKPKSPNRSSSSSSRSGSRKGSCFPVTRHSRTTKGSSSSSSSPPSDPNDESFTHEMLRVMIETNDFSCHECNPHR